ncbi:hypothetical protein DdX_19443 [Ditylenchus destructor]|uniref:Uncharacterized protein n=1 Tax=Ditylenchus destructor TaxID=166010 RepID=A0AAD4MJN9_9BILA|nr:hypothetical protein DdX_19443 [Ditylenchus destructor]
MGKYVQYKRGYSGSIIGKKWILSSTFSPLHDPTKELEKYYVITGARDLYRLQTAGPMVSMYTVKNITVHPKYLIDKDAEFSVNLIESTYMTKPGEKKEERSRPVYALSLSLFL